MEESLFLFGLISFIIVIIVISLCVFYLVVSDLPDHDCNKSCQHNLDKGVNQ